MTEAPEGPALHSESPSVSGLWAVIVTFNARGQALHCLKSLHRPELAGLQIVVVDNASTDGTADAVEAGFPAVTVLRSTLNTGYTGGNNQGIRLALEHGAQYVLILNPDTEVVHPKFVKELVSFMEASPDVGVVGPRVFLGNCGVVQNTVLTPPSVVRNFVHWFRYRTNRDFGHRSGDAVVEAEVLNGVCLLMRASCLREVGLFDEHIFAYIEDMDLDHRVREHGWRVVYVPVDSVVHLQDPDNYSMTSLASFLIRRNTAYYLLKVGKRADAWGYAVFSLLLMAIRGMVSFGDGAVAEHFRFCGRLARAYRQILLRRSFNENFGPPFSMWTS